jgi:hypothetical protein
MYGVALEAYLDLSVLHFGNRHILIPKIFLAMEPQGFHGRRHALIASSCTPQGTVDTSVVVQQYCCAAQSQARGRAQLIIVTKVRRTNVKYVFANKPLSS